LANKKYPQKFDIDTKKWPCLKGSTIVWVSMLVFGGAYPKFSLTLSLKQKQALLFVGFNSSHPGIGSLHPETRLDLGYLLKGSTTRIRTAEKDRGFAVQLRRFFLRRFLN